MWVWGTDEYVGPKKVFQAFADLLYGDPLVGENSSQCLWAGMKPRANRSQQSSLLKFQET